MSVRVTIDDRGGLARAGAARAFCCVRVLEILAISAAWRSNVDLVAQEKRRMLDGIMRQVIGDGVMLDDVELSVRWSRRELDRERRPIEPGMSEDNPARAWRRCFVEVRLEVTVTELRR